MLEILHGDGQAMQDIRLKDDARLVATDVPFDGGAVMANIIGSFSGSEPLSTAFTNPLSLVV